MVEDANVAPYADDRVLSWRYGVERPDPAPNELKAPIGVAEISRALGLSLSTTHRQVRSLIDAVGGITVNNPRPGSEMAQLVSTE